MIITTDLKDLTPAEIEKFCINALGQKPGQGIRVAICLYRKKIEDFDGMIDLNRLLREQLKQRCTISTLVVQRQAISEDGTKKFLFDLSDGNAVEGVIIPGPGGSRPMNPNSATFGRRRTVLSLDAVDLAARVPAFDHELVAGLVEPHDGDLGDIGTEQVGRPDFGAVDRGDFGGVHDFDHPTCDLRVAVPFGRFIRAAVQRKPGIALKVAGFASVDHAADPQFAAAELNLRPADTGRTIQANRCDRLVRVRIHALPHLLGQLRNGGFDLAPGRH